MLCSTRLSIFHGSQVYTTPQYCNISILKTKNFDKSIANFAAMIGNPLSLELEDMDIAKTLKPQD